MNIRVDNLLRTVEDVKQIKVRKDGRIFELQDLCDVRYEARNPEGYSLYQGKRAVTLAIIKRSEEGMESFKKAVEDTRGYFAGMYTDINFDESRDQTKLLDYAIDNLEQNHILGLILVFIVCALFMKDVRSPLAIGINIVVAIIMTFLIFYLCHVSVNIISLSGLILAVGMMIDNSVIVTENITQYRVRGLTLRRSCIAGTNEMITPMLSSSLTTIAVFVPLVFMSGIAGAIFADQAFSITAGLGASYIVGITLLPVLYYILHARKSGKITVSRIDAASSDSWLIRVYDRGVDWVFSHRMLCIAATVATLPLCAVMFSVLRHERMPDIDTDEVNMVIDWNENIDIEQNRHRSSMIADSVKSLVAEYSAAVGLQDYMLDAGNGQSATETELYFRTDSPDDVPVLQDSLLAFMTRRYPQSTVAFSRPENIFEKIFSTDERDIEARIYSTDRSASPAVTSLLALRRSLEETVGCGLSEIPLRPQINIAVDREKLALYRVDFSEIRNALNGAFKGEFATTLRSHQEYVPIAIEGEEKELEDVLNNTLVKSRRDADGNITEIPLNRLIEITRSRDLKNITANGAGEYVAFGFDFDGDVDRVTGDVRTAVRNEGDFDVEFAGTIFASEKMIRELAVILVVALLLMYFILCAQFESFLQPLIVLVEIPIDTFFALVTLWMCGQTLNLMSAIGIIVTCGIVVNDSILKIDAINELRKDGVPLMDAIHTAGRRRLRAILMTSLTTIFAMVPLLFTSDMGSELQRPLAIAMIGSMVVGTVVSVLIIPLLYWFIYRKHDKKAF